jgi:hypothetical protein
VKNSRIHVFGATSRAADGCELFGPKLFNLLRRDESQRCPGFVSFWRSFSWGCLICSSLLVFHPSLTTLPNRRLIPSGLSRTTTFDREPSDRLCCSTWSGDWAHLFIHAFGLRWISTTWPRRSYLPYITAHTLAATHSLLLVDSIYRHVPYDPSVTTPPTSHATSACRTHDCNTNDI